MKIRMFVALSLLLSFCAPAAAHPPAQIDAEFSIISHDLTVTIVHPVADPETHYIDAVRVSLNNQVVIDDKLDRQDNNASIMVIYNIPTAGLGDNIVIYAHCNKGGDKEQKLTVM